MGGCASKPNAQDGSDPAALPAENTAEQAVRSVEGGAPTEAKTEVVEESKEEPLVDLSEPKPKESAAAAADHEELAPGISELKAEAPVEPAEPKEVEKVADDEAAEEEAGDADAAVHAEKTEEEAAEQPMESSH